jgi:CRP/FNR family transcriptional regulator, cyclic AMP receptor protein
MELGRLGVRLRRATVRRGAHRVGGLARQSHVRALLLQRSVLTLARPALADVGGGGVLVISRLTRAARIWIVHTGSVPRARRRNRPLGRSESTSRASTMSTTAKTERVPVHDPRLDLTRHLSEDERAELGNISLPALTIPPGSVDLSSLLLQYKAFGATVLEGIVISAHQIGEQTGIQVLGPGDLLAPGGDPLPDWLAEVEFRAPASLSVALLGNELLAAAYRWPRIIQGLYARMGDQLERLTAQLVICQLPRVDERVLAMMWLLAESWGQVTSAGVRLPLGLTHETLGALVGARRPTVTLALRKLARQGSILHQDTGWLLLEPPPQPAQASPKILPPEPLDASISRWIPPSPPPDPSIAYAELRDTVRRLREQHVQDREQTREQLQRVRIARVRMTAAREQILRDVVSRRPPPSS